MKIFNYIYALLLCLHFNIHASHVSFEKQGGDTLILHIKFDSLKTLPVKTQQTDRFTIPLHEDHYLLLSESSQIDITMLHKRLKPLKMDEVELVHDISLGAEMTGNQDRISVPTNFYQLILLGKYGHFNVFQILVSPLIQNHSGSDIQWIEEMKFQCSGQSIQIVMSPQLHSDILNSIYNSQNSDQLTKIPTMHRQITKSSESLAGKKRLKMWIDEEGLYVLHHAMIENAGFEVSGVNPKYLRIFNQNGEVPIHIVGGEDGSFDFLDYIEFYGEPIWDTHGSDEKRLHVFSTHNIYWLEIGEQLGLRIGQKDVHIRHAGNPSSRSYLYLEHFEEDQYFNRLPYTDNVTDADYWFYGPGIADEEQRRFLFDLKLPDPFSTQLVSIRVKLRGNSESYQDIQVEVYLNDHYVGQSKWSEKQEITIETHDFSPTYIHDSDNQLTVLNKASQGTLSHVYLDWFEIEYPRIYKSVDDYIRFHPPPYSQGKRIEFRIEGFSQPDISLYQIHSSRLVGSDVRESTDTLGVTTYTLIFQDSILHENSEYCAVTPHVKLLPDSLMRVEFWDLKHSGLTADYIAIVPDDSLGEDMLYPLLELRQSQGLKTMVVSIDTLYNEFTGGIPDPSAIQQFLSYAYEHWDPPPQYVLLVGDGYFDQRAGPEMGNLMPVRLYQTYKYGAAPSDFYYTLLSGHDELPEIALGRLPIRDREGLKRVVEKIVSFETSPSGPWKNRYLMIGSGGSNEIFRTQSETVINEILPHSYSPRRLYLSGSLSDPYVGGTEDLFRYLEDGVAMVNFRGHGGGAIWADAGLLQLNDIELIENSQYLPIITSMTCFTADFASHRTCLGEALLCQEYSGAVAFWGATGVGWTITDYTLLKEIYHLLAIGEVKTLGELIRQAKINFRLLNTSNIDQSEIFQFTLLGDPATRLPFPNETLDFNITPRSIDPGNPLLISGETDLSSLDALFEITKSNYDPIDYQSFQIDQNDWQFNLSVPETMNQGKAGVRILLWDESKQYFYHGFHPFQIGAAFFDSIRTIPAVITNEDSVGFSAVVESAEQMKQVWCEIFFPATDSIAMVQSGDRLYHSQYTVGPFSNSQSIRYAILGQNQSGIIYSSDTLSTFVQPLPNLAVQSVQLSGTDKVYLKTTLRNYNSNYELSDDPYYTEMNTLDSVVIRYQIPELSMAMSDTVSMPGLPEYTVTMPFYPPVKNVQLIITVNPDSSLAETTVQDNTRRQYLQSDRFNVTPEYGSMIHQNENGAVGLQGKIDCTVPPGALSRESVVLLKDYTVTEVNAQGNETIRQSYFIDFPEISGYPKLNKEMTLQLHILEKDTTGLTKIYHRKSSDGISAVVLFEKKEDIYEVKTCETGFFSVQTTQDVNPPEIEIQIETQPFAMHSYISRNPSISIIIRDESGVDIRPGKVIIELNGRTQNESHFSLPDSLSDQKQVIVTYQPELRSGDYQLLIMASDIHGNVQDPQLYQFKVSDVFEIQYLGNYPNPFKRETTFVYILTASATEAALKIYTVSGRLIKVFDHYELASPDYHEVLWDGTDDYGEEVANGVYFFKLEATGMNQKRHITGKIAKIR